MKDVVSRYPTYDNINTYAHLLFKVGQKKLASETASEAIRVAKTNKEDYSNAEELKKLISKGS